jgi:predicted ATPase
MRLTAGDHVFVARSDPGYFAYLPSVAGEFRAALAAIQSQFATRPYAFAPIRTSPQRTYDPVSSEPRPEGSHIPMLLATLARSASSQGWRAMQSALQDFGSKSGLFDGIEIVNKGRKESDPFQIGIRSGGPAVNLIDVGYGVSQSLPLLVDTIRQAAGHELFLLQQPEVHLHPRAQAELGSFFASQARKDRKFVIETHSDHLVDRVRMEVRRKKLKPEDVSLLYFERGKHGATIHNLELDRNGGIVNPPEGYRQFFLNEERDLLGI